MNVTVVPARATEARPLEYPATLPPRDRVRRSLSVTSTSTGKSRWGPPTIEPPLKVMEMERAKVP